MSKSEMPNRPNERYEIPQYLIDDIESIDEDSIVSDEAFRISEKIEPGIKEREKIIELLKNLIEPSTGNKYGDRKKAEFIVAQLRAMNVPLDDFYNMLGMGYAPEMVADKILQERDEG